MGKRSENNFKKRFGDPLRVELKFAEKPLEGFERKHQTKKIVDAVEQVLTSALGRKPTRDELLGNVPLPKGRRNAVKASKPTVDYQI